MSAPSPTDDALADALDERKGTPQSIDELVALEDADGLIQLGAAYRVGSPHLERDLFKAVECFEAASRFGSAEAEYLVGIAFLNGLGVSKDLAEGAKRMRSSAQRGSLRAKVYVANLYEMGVHYAHDRDKADVWYRNVARAAGIDADPTGDDYVLAMAELGCVRHCLQLVSDESLPTKDRAVHLQTAKAMGYGHRLADAKRQSAVPDPARSEPEEAEQGAPPTPDPADAGEEDVGEEDASEEDAKKEDAKREEAKKEDTKAAQDQLGAQWTFGAGLLAFVVAALFAVGSFFTAWLAAEGSIALAEHGRALPTVGEMHDLVFGAVILVFGVLPACAVYRVRVVAIAALVGLGAASVGWYLHSSRAFDWSEGAQAGAFGLAGALLILLVLGVLGGTRLRDKPAVRAT